MIFGGNNNADQGFVRGFRQHPVPAANHRFGWLNFPSPRGEQLFQASLRGRVRFILKISAERMMLWNLAPMVQNPVDVTDS